MHKNTFNKHFSNKQHSNKQLLALIFFAVSFYASFALAEVNVPQEESQKALKQIEQSLDKVIENKVVEGKAKQKESETKLEKFQDNTAVVEKEKELVFNVLEIKVNGNSVLPIGTIEETV